MPLDEDAVAAIYREHGGILHRLALRATGDAHQAEEIVHEVVLRMWRQAPEPDNVRAYLSQSVRNLAVDRHRAAQRRPISAGREVDADGREEAARETDLGGSDIDRALDTLLVEESLRRLSSEHLAVVRLLYYRRLSVAEAAEALSLIHI